MYFDAHAASFTAARIWLCGKDTRCLSVVEGAPRLSRRFAPLESLLPVDFLLHTFDAAAHVTALTARQRQILDLVLGGAPSKNVGEGGALGGAD